MLALHPFNSSRLSTSAHHHSMAISPGGSPKKGNQEINKEKTIFFQIFIGDAFPNKKLSGRNFGVLGPENSDSSSKTTYMDLFPGSNSSIQEN